MRSTDLWNFPRDSFEPADHLLVNRIAEAMRQVGWQGDPAIVQTPDMLKHGFHRAHAAYEAGIDLEALVVRSWLWEWALEQTGTDEKASDLILRLWRNDELDQLDESELRSAAECAEKRRQESAARLSKVFGRGR